MAALAEASQAGSAAGAASAASAANATQHGEKGKTVASIVLGMAGSGKTTLMQRINAHVHERNNPSYMLNLDPAVLHVPYKVHIDIRDTVNYKEVMKQYSLGPNGAIITSLNLFATRVDKVISILEKRAPEKSWITYFAILRGKSRYLRGAHLEISLLNLLRRRFLLFFFTSSIRQGRPVAQHSCQICCTLAPYCTS